MKWIITSDGEFAVRADWVAQLAVTNYQGPDAQRWCVAVYVPERGNFYTGEFTSREAAAAELRHLVSQLQEAQDGSNRDA